MANIQKSKPLAQRRPIEGLFSDNPFARLREEMDDVFNQYFGPMVEGNGNNIRAETFGSLDLSETDNGLEVTVDMPGVDARNVDIKLIGDDLQITGHREEEQVTEEKNFHRMERSYGAFRRQVTLPCEVNAEKVDAELKDGVLKIKLQKSAETKKRTRKIEIKTR